MSEAHDKGTYVPMQAQSPQLPEISELIGSLNNIAELLSALLESSLQKNRPAKNDSREMQAIMLLMELGPKPREISRQLGINHRALYRLPKFMRYYRSMSQADSPRQARRGFRTDQGVEAID